MQWFQSKTDITSKNYYSQTKFIDYNTQASDYKSYPKFFRRYEIDEYKELKFISNFGKTTFLKKYGNDEVSLRTTPSAGGLYPCEIYIQIRGVKSFLSGIYHYEPKNNTLVLIHEFSNDGLESYFNTNSKKFIFLISAVYFRSSWKYEQRAIRYLLLDSGHQLGAICASLNEENIEFKISFDFDKNALEEDFAFDNKEYFQCAILVENEKESTYKKLREKIVHVSPTNYFIKDSFIEDFFKKSKNETFNDIENLNILKDLDKKTLLNTIESRRSARYFKDSFISKNEFDFISKGIFDYIKNSSLEIYHIICQSDDIKSGVYKNVTLLKEGNFSKEITKLAFNQSFVLNSSMLIIYTSKNIDNLSNEYLNAGLLAHFISLRALSINITSSGIGAYFDDLTKEFLDTQNSILYFQVLGKQ